LIGTDVFDRQRIGLRLRRRKCVEPLEVRHELFEVSVAQILGTANE
jgi:hypothetical protein